MHLDIMLILCMMFSLLPLMGASKDVIGEMENAYEKIYPSYLFHGSWTLGFHSVNIEEQHFKYQKYIHDTSYIVSNT